MTENEIGKIVVDACYHIHRELGPGLLEKVYEIILADRLRSKRLSVQRQVVVPIVFDGKQFEEGFAADIIVENKVILELKSIETVHPVHKKQLLTYLRLTGMKLGYLLNFGEELMKTGVSRIINGNLE
ncbi:MAG: GxxExxY protein [Planctomycetaceae bacterium]|jgi:GxxExxY protein|nr:GxxExxY protein [Planctomycetaceae bacterium]